MVLTTVHVPGPNPPIYLGNNFYCESGPYHNDPYYLSDPLWDGTGCGTGNGCCAQIGMLWFYRKLTVAVAEDFEVRICKDQDHANEDVAVEKLKLYVL